MVQPIRLPLHYQGNSHIRVGKLNLVDLAGSERQAKTGATGDRLKEATKINLRFIRLVHWFCVVLVSTIIQYGYNKYQIYLSAPVAKIIFSLNIALFLLKILFIFFR